MYIWILLATIMISLSFFNLSPRADKEGVFTEVKASSLINRFRIEHTAFSRVAECILINSIACNNCGITKFPRNETDETLMQQNLPIGYTGAADLTTTHYTYCLMDDVEKGGSPAVADNCLDSVSPVFRYSVSFAPIPDRWISKDDGSPLPTLSNAMAKVYIKGSIVGIARCSVPDTDSEGNPIENQVVDGCTFQGTESYVKAIVANTKSGLASSTESTGILSFNGSSGFYHELFRNTDFKDSCGGACFFAIHELSKVDVDFHCQALGYTH